MAELSDVSCKMYRGYVRENKDFVPYFRSATPEQELGNCRWVRVRQNVVQPAASSRCAPFRGSSPDPEPPDAAGRLGAGAALQKVVEGGKQSELEAMSRLAVLLYPPRHAGDGLLEGRPVAGGYYDQRR